MKISTLTYVLGTAFLLTALGAHASDGTITFNGNVGNQTCKINGTLGGNANQTVTLPLVNLSDLKSPGSQAGKTNFQLQITDCSYSKVRTLFSGGSTVEASSGTLINQTVDGADVNVMVYNDTGVKIDMGTSQNSQTVSIQNQTATLNYSAAYYASGSGASRSGPVSTSIEYSMFYE